MFKRYHHRKWGLGRDAGEVSGEGLLCVNVCFCERGTVSFRDYSYRGEIDIMLCYLAAWKSDKVSVVFLCDRKHKAPHKSTTTDDKRLQSTLKRLGVNTIPGIEEVNIFKDENVINFSNPKGMLPRYEPHCRLVGESIVVEEV